MTRREWQLALKRELTSEQYLRMDVSEQERVVWVTTKPGFQAGIPLRDVATVLAGVRALLGDVQREPNPERAIIPYYPGP